MDTIDPVTDETLIARQQGGLTEEARTARSRCQPTVVPDGDQAACACEFIVLRSLAGETLTFLEKAMFEAAEPPG